MNKGVREDQLIESVILKVAILLDGEAPHHNSEEIKLLYQQKFLKPIFQINRPTALKTYISGNIDLKVFLCEIDFSDIICKDTTAKSFSYLFQ